MVFKFQYGIFLGNFPRSSRIQELNVQWIWRTSAKFFWSFASYFGRFSGSWGIRRNWFPYWDTFTIYILQLVQLSTIFARCTSCTSIVMNLKHLLLQFSTVFVPVLGFNRQFLIREFIFGSFGSYFRIIFGNFRNFLKLVVDF